MNLKNNFFKLHPDNPRYFYFRGEALALITSTEHYGAVINLDFDYVEYLDMLKKMNFRLSRIFVFMREQPGSCSGLEAKEGLYFSELGRQNTLAPDRTAYIAPWQRCSEPGCFDGGNRFDLTKWDEAYFQRLRDFCSKAGERGIVVEVTFFSNMYSGSDTGPWKVCPINCINNVNGIGNIEYFEFTGLLHIDVVNVQIELVKKVVWELKDCGNIYYEICNEPNPFPNDPKLEYQQIAEWQNYFVDLISDLEAGFENKHLIAICDPNEHYDFSKAAVLNFHYEEWISKGMDMYYKLNKPIAFDETLTGIVAWNRSMDFENRRREAWQYIMSGCSVYNYLDFTIATDDPEGAGKALFPYGQHYNGEIMRLYLKHLNDFINSIDFIKMQPDISVIKGSYSAATVNVLAEKGKAYAVYIYGSSIKYLQLDLPAGCYNADWFNPRTGRIVANQYGINGGDVVALEVPLYESDIALRLKVCLVISDTYPG